MSRPHATAVALTAGCLLGLGGCGHTEIVDAGRAVHVALREYRITPDDVRAPAGVLDVYVHNYGRLTHNLVVSENGQATAQIQPLAPGQGTVLALNLAPGRYSMASTILSDEDLGAYGTLTVTG